MQVDKARLDATYTHEASEAGHLYYIALGGRAPAPYAEQRHVQAILDIAPDGTLAGVELIDNMPPPPLRSTEGKEAEPVAHQHRVWFPDTQKWSEWREGSKPLYDNDFQSRTLYATTEASEALVAKLREALELLLSKSEAVMRPL